MAGLNVYAIDAGTDTSKLGYSDNLSTRIIARLDGFDPLSLREEAEIFCDEPVFSCVAAVNPGTHHENIRAKILASGFTEAEIIPAHEALITALNYPGKVLVYDFGASGSRLVVLEGHEVLESVIIPDVCGSGFDKAFAEYLAERRLLRSVNEAVIREARRIKHVLSEDEVLKWHGLEILRSDFERLIHFSVKRARHTADRLLRVHRPERFILTGGCVKIPAVRKIFADMKPEIQEDVIITGASLKARSVGRAARKTVNRTDTASKLKELRAGMIELEDKLTRKQKDRLYVLFRQAEGINDSGIIAIMENLIRDIRQA